MFFLNISSILYERLIITKEFQQLEDNNFEREIQYPKAVKNEKSKNIEEEW